MSEHIKSLRRLSSKSYLLCGQTIITCWNSHLFVNSEANISAGSRYIVFKLMWVTHLVHFEYMKCVMRNEVIQFKVTVWLKIWNHLTSNTTGNVCIINGQMDMETGKDQTRRNIHFRIFTFTCWKKHTFSDLCNNVITNLKNIGPRLEYRNVKQNQDLMFM